MDFDKRCLLNYKEHTLNHHDTSAKFWKVVDNLLKSRRFAQVGRASSRRRFPTSHKKHLYFFSTKERSLIFNRAVRFIL